METKIVESKATSTDWLTQLQDLIEIIETDEKLAIYSDAQHKEGFTFILISLPSLLVFFYYYIYTILYYIIFIISFFLF